MTGPLIKPMIRPFITGIDINSITSGSDLYLNFFDDQYFINKSEKVDIDVAVTEGRSTDAYVLDGGGNYILRSANEPAQANGHGLDGFDEVVNVLTVSAAPSDLTGTSLIQPGSGGTLTLEDQTTELGAIGLSAVTGGDAYFIDNTSGDDVLSMDITTPSFDSAANDFNISAILRGTSGVILRTSNGSYTQVGAISQTVFSRIETNKSLIASGSTSAADLLRVEVPVGEWAYVSLPQVVVGGDFNVPLVPPSSTRDADDTRVVQGDDGGSPTIAPGFSANPNELTFRVDWDEVAQSGEQRVFMEVVNTGMLRLAFRMQGNGDLVFRGDSLVDNVIINAGPSFDDGGPHTAVFYINRTTGVTKLSVDGEATLTDTVIGAMPVNLDLMKLNESLTFPGSPLNGTNCRIQVSQGDFYDAFRDSSAGFF